MSDEMKSHKSFHAVSAAVKAGVLVIVLGLVVLGMNHPEMLPQDSIAIGVVDQAMAAEANKPAEAVYLPTRRR